MEETTNTDPKVKYDFLFILSPLLPEEKATEEANKMIKIIESHGGSVFASEMPKLRALAYPVVKTWEGKKSTFDQGMFGSLKLEVESSEVPAIKKEFDAFQYLLRSAITYAYLDVRPVRKIPVTEGVSEESIVSSLPPELVNVTPTPKATELAKDKADEVAPRKIMSEAEIDKQIEDLLA